jgi:hypothetical protein
MKKPNWGPIPTIDQIPAELRDQHRWIGCKAVWDDGKQGWKKPPTSPVDGSAIGATAKYSAHFLAAEEAIAGCNRLGLDALGFVILEGDNIVGIDIDSCIKDGVVDPTVLQWAKWLPTYVEESPSRTGLHFIGRGKLKQALTATPLPNADGATIEMYSDSRYLTWTGLRFGDVDRIADVQIGTDKVLKSLNVKTAGDGTGDGAQRPMLLATVRKFHQDNLEEFRTMKSASDPQNDKLNACAYFAARAFLSGALDKTEEELKTELRTIAESSGHCPSIEPTLRSGWNKGTAAGPLIIVENLQDEALQRITAFLDAKTAAKKKGKKAKAVSQKDKKAAEAAVILDAALLSASDYDKVRKRLASAFGYSRPTEFDKEVAKHRERPTAHASDKKQIITNIGLGSVVKVTKESEDVLHAIGLKYFERNGELVNSAYGRELPTYKNTERAADSVVIVESSSATIVRDLDTDAQYVKMKGDKMHAVAVPKFVPGQIVDRVSRESRDVPFDTLDLVTGSPVLLPSGVVSEKIFEAGVLFRPSQRYTNRSIK